MTEWKTEKPNQKTKEETNDNRKTKQWKFHLLYNEGWVANSESFLRLYENGSKTYVFEISANLVQILIAHHRQRKKTKMQTQNYLPSPRTLTREELDRMMDTPLYLPAMQEVSQGKRLHVAAKNWLHNVVMGKVFDS